MRCLLNDKRINSFQVLGKRQEYWDQSLPGFGVRVSKKGQKTFFVMFRNRGKQRRFSLGRYPLLSLSEARELAREKLRLITLGCTPEQKKTEFISVEEVFSSFIELYAKKKNKDWKRTEQRLKLSLIKEYGSADIQEITRENIIDMLDKIVARDAPIQANRVLAGVSKFLKWCAERGYIQENPARYISRPANENPRDRVWWF